MTVTAEGLRARALPDGRDEPAHETHGGVDVPLSQARSGSRGHTAAILVCLVFVQVAWLAALGHVAYSLLR